MLVAQNQGPTTGGLAALDQALRFLGQHKRVLMIAAHPDDEDTELLTILARGQGAEAAYLALTRGEGGQNLIGNELGPALGVLRTGELLAARSLDGARQFFTRAYDFGFSKTLDDTWRFWPRDSVLKDVVRVIRRFRPQVVVAIFSGTPRDGHGQHQASGWAAREAFRAAGDPARFPELGTDEGLTPWTPLKLYQSARFDGSTPDLTLEGGLVDRAVGQSYHQIAMRGRSLHRSQDMGAAQRMGPSTVRLRVVEDRTGRARAGLFAGIDTTLAALLPAGRRAGARQAADRLAARFRRVSPLGPADLPALRRALLAFLGPDSTWLPEARDQMRRLDEATALASGVLCDAVADREQVAPGGRLSVVLSCWNTASRPVEVSARLIGPGGSVPVPLASLVPGAVVADTLAVAVPASAEPTGPYYLALPPDGALYRWRPVDRAVWGEPFEPAPFAAEFVLPGGVTVRREVEYRRVDQAVGEIRRPVFVVPAVEMRLDPASALWPASPSAPREFLVRLRSHVEAPVEVRVGLAASGGWTAPASQTVRLAPGARDTVVRFEVPAPAVVGRAALSGELALGGITGPGLRVERVEYPHLRPRQVLLPARAPVAVAEIRLEPGRRIGYVRGAADRIPEALASLGLALVPLTADSLAQADLSRYDAVVIGPRAYETEPALHRHNARLLGYAENGGTVVVQYQQQAYFAGGFAPYPLSLSPAGAEPGARVAAARVAEEDAAVAVLDPGHPVFRTPHLLGPEDWSGWVQERGLYFPRSWAGEWAPLLEMADTGEPPQRGALLVAAVGRGRYLYTGLSFFRQLPAAVPGAARLFLNLLDWK